MTQTFNWPSCTPRISFRRAPGWARTGRIVPSAWDSKENMMAKPQAAFLSTLHYPLSTPHHSLEQRRPDADDCCALLDRLLEIAAHAHRKLVQRMARRAAVPQTVAQLAAMRQNRAGQRPGRPLRPPCTSARGPRPSDSRPDRPTAARPPSGGKPCLAASPETFTSREQEVRREDAASGRRRLPHHRFFLTAANGAGCRSNGSSPPAAAFDRLCCAASGRSDASGAADR